MTTSQIIVLVVGGVVFLICLSYLKKTVRLVSCMASLVLTLIVHGLITPSQVIDVAQVIKDKGVSAYQSIADTSNRIKMSGSNTSVLFEDTWIDISSVADYSISGDTVTIQVGGKSYSVNDKNVAKLFRMFE